jgi:hypothetical protein
MTDDQLWRIAIGGGAMGLLAYFKPQISRWLHKIGYRDWRKPPQ